MTIIQMFPGQGSHRPGMGGELFERYPHLVRQADDLLGYSIEELCLRSSEEELTDTRYTQCAMYVVGALSYVDGVRRNGVIPDAVAGHSLGEYVGLFAAGAFDFLTGLELVAERAEAMGDVGPGAMAAVIGTGLDELRNAIARHAVAEVIDVANLNAPDQTVFSGPVDDVRDLVSALRREGLTVLPLGVSGAFHSHYMAPAAERFGAVLQRYRFAELKLPVISNVTARPHRGDEIAELLRRQLTEPVRWAESIEYLMTLPDPEFQEVGPGRVLTGLVQRIGGHASAVGEVQQAGAR